MKTRRDGGVKFYTIKLPKFVGGIVKAFIGVFSKD
ncbi:stage V sporulation protein SpoVM [Alicyclobacillus macrosporangiidus]|nr:stage V sporulation protein SpoVM [Alicyclobacillus macrosporangiidus]